MTELRVDLINRLQTYREKIIRDPLSNPARQLAHELSVDIEADRLDLDTLKHLTKELSDEAFVARSLRLKEYLGLKDNPHPLEDIVKQDAATCQSLEAFAKKWSRRRDMVVFTGHPTFLLSEDLRHLLGEMAMAGPSDKLLARLEKAPHQPDDPISLSYEHKAVISAMGHATTAVSKLHTLLLEAARRKWPDEWRSFMPQTVGLASWVGYDMDGRNDIGWKEVITHRLIEKEYRVAYYISRVKTMTETSETNRLLDKLTAIHEHTAKAVQMFSANLDAPSDLKEAADFLTENTSAKQTSISLIIKDIDAIISDVSDDEALAFASLKSDMATFGYGAGEIHFRLNASQVKNAARHVLQLSRTDDLFARGALNKVQELIANTKPEQVNFAALSIEEASAARLCIAMAQILKHIDSDQSIRLLIAECENPVTVLSAIYLARQFGVEKHVDICPLFETGAALDRSRRILDVLFQQPEFRKYAKTRGRIAIQAGFSDAGRFMGQIPAALAIERLQGHFADLMDKHGFADLEAIIFDTHGESMGRGNHQASMIDRGLYALSPWARHQFAKRGIHLIHETSFQGGDGYALYGHETLAEATLSGVIAAHKASDEALAKPDLFYEDISTSLDFYRKVKRRQEELFDDKAYHTTLSALGLPLLPTTGSRKSKRQFDRRSEDDASLRKIRAIPHNAILQQMGLLANILGGIGNALSAEPDYFVKLQKESDRFARLMAHVARARSLSEMKTMIAYMKLFDGSFWATRPLSGLEPQIENACGLLAAGFASDNRYFAALQLAARLRTDSIVLDRELEAMDLLPQIKGTPLTLDLLHVVRIALIQHLFLLAGRIPDFSPAGGISRSDVAEMIFSLEIPEATRLLRVTFPADALGIQDFKLAEKSTYPNSDGHVYDSMYHDFIEPLEQTYEMVQSITVGIAHYYSAVG